MTDYWNKEILVIGCGNILFGDDGFGPAVVDYLHQHYVLPTEVGVVNAGLAVRDILFNLILGENRPQKILLVDTMEMGQSPGEIYEFPVEYFNKIPDSDFSFHQVPTIHLLQELQEQCGVDVSILCIQPEYLPEEVSSQLSKTIQDALPKVSRMIYEKIVSFSHESPEE